MEMYKILLYKTEYGFNTVLITMANSKEEALLKLSTKTLRIISIEDIEECEEVESFKIPWT